MNDKRTRTPEEEVQRLHDLTNAGVFNEGIPTPPAPPAAEEDEEGEDLDDVAADVRRVAAQTADLPPLDRIEPREPTLRVEVEVPESQVVHILQAAVSADTVGRLTDLDIVRIVTGHQQDRATDPVMVDLDPYRRRVKQMQQTAMPPSLNWPDTGGTPQ